MTKARREAERKAASATGGTPTRSMRQQTIRTLERNAARYEAWGWPVCAERCRRLVQDLRGHAEDV